MSEVNLNSPEVTPEALDKYTPAPKTERQGNGLCLSGGGFRASLFHLGALTRLNELGILEKIDTVSSVSGGSILAGFMATRLQFPIVGRVGDWNERVVEPFRRFTSKNIRNWPILSRLLPWNWFDSDNGVEHLQSTYDEHLTDRKLLKNLPLRPSFIFCATDMQFGVNWMFTSRRVGDYQAGNVTPAPLDWPVAKAVAASSCFPPVFNPMKLDLDEADFDKTGKAHSRAEYKECVSDMRLTDGGCYDNLGLEPIWKSHRVLLCSDGGGTFDFEADKHLLWRVQRYSSILDNQVGALRKRWLISNFIAKILDGTYWGIGSDVQSFKATLGYSTKLVDSKISEIRTDLDSFTDAEASILMNHGYTLAEAAIRRHMPGWVAPEAPAAVPPYPEWMDEARVDVALKESGKRKIFGH
jgi:NTE family protein